MRKVYKYVLPIDDHLTIPLPQGAEILKVDTQAGIPCMWALANPEKPSEVRRFRFAGTGHPIEEENLKFIDTFQMDSGSLVFHFFEIIK
ncbi:MAG: hypothetical protein B7C24_17440 [Bacteroidetes bacterium 4572_77]|nr:MAG: hypothetical protein B7C24_17440 [Bacteroidetes bacterium 4572_77]